MEQIEVEIFVTPCQTRKRFRRRYYEGDSNENSKYYLSRNLLNTKGA